MHPLWLVKIGEIVVAKVSVYTDDKYSYVTNGGIGVMNGKGSFFDIGAFINPPRKFGRMALYYYISALF